MTAPRPAAPNYQRIIDAARQCTAETGNAAPLSGALIHWLLDKVEALTADLAEAIRLNLPDASPDDPAVTRLNVGDTVHAWMAAGYRLHRRTKIDATITALESRAFASDTARASAETALADDIRALGWSVAVHNDYRLNDEPHTFWLFTKDGRAVKGEGKTDAEALNQIRAALEPRT